MASHVFDPFCMRAEGRHGSVTDIGSPDGSVAITTIR
jgi:hypothetical protein